MQLLTEIRLNLNENDKLAFSFGSTSHKWLFHISQIFKFQNPDFW